MEIPTFRGQAGDELAAQEVSKKVDGEPSKYNAMKSKERSF